MRKNPEGEKEDMFRAVDTEGMDEADVAEFEELFKRAKARLEASKPSQDADSKGKNK